MSELIINWIAYLKKGRRKLTLFISLLVLSIVLFVFYRFLNFNEYRSGFPLNDPILNFFPPQDFSIFIFILTYGFCLAGILIAIRSPDKFILLLQAYSLMTLLRMTSLYLIPLDPPAGIIPLHDVFLQNSFYAGRDNLRDLFFSGHTTTLFIFSFMFTGKKIRIVYILIAIVVGILIIWQHVHYSIDVLAAPIVAIMILWILKKTKRIQQIN